MNSLHVTDHNFFIKSVWFLDILTSALAWYLSYIVRVVILKGDPNLSGMFIDLSPFLFIVTIYTFFKNQVYDNRIRFSIQSEILRVGKANLIATLGFVIVLYFFADSRFSRATLLIYFIVSTILFIFLRITLRALLRKRRQMGKGLIGIVLVGAGKQLTEYIQTINRMTDGGVRVLGWMDSNDTHGYYKIPNMSLSEIKERFSPHMIVIGYSNQESAKLTDLMKQHYNDLISIQILPDLSYSIVGQQVESFLGIPVLNLNTPNISIMDVFLKRLFDFIFALFGLLILSPVFILLAILIRINSPGPIFFIQKRVGLNGKPFNMLKFRTMQNMGPDKPAWTVANDPRRTKIGSFLRRTSLDELPQLFNVLMGNMSLVGPRPEQQFYVEKFRNEIPGYMLRHKMKAGITGWAQVNGWRGDTSIQKRVECDIFYIKNWSLWMDLKILFLTFWKGFINKNAY